MLRITAVCSAGVGTSVFCTDLIKNIIKEQGYKSSDFKVTCTELSSARGLSTDIIVTQKAMVKRIPQKASNPIPVIGVKSLVSNTGEMAEALKPYFDEAVAAGKISAPEK